jgi:hypothetical protein
MTRAQQLDKEADDLARIIGRAWIRVATLCRECREQRFYKELGYERFGDWVEAKFGRSRSTAYAGMQAIEELCAGGMDGEEIESLTLANAIVLSKVPTSRRQELLEAANSETERTFEATVAEHVPGLALEGNVQVFFTVPRSFVEVIERCIEKAKLEEETESRMIAVEAIFADFDLRHASSSEISRACERDRDAGTGQSNA